MDLESLRTLFTNNPSVALLAAMAVLATADFLAASIGHLRAGTFTLILWGKWAGEKGLPILSVALLFALDYATKFLSVTIGDFDLGIFGLTAIAQGGSFCATQGFSIIKNLNPPPAEDEVPNEIVGG